MRMWCVDVKKMCRKHLLGEHVETHMMVGTLKRGISINGYINDGLYQMDKIRERHDEIVSEMERRGYNHQSPLPEFSYDGPNGLVKEEENIKELKRRCEECRKKLNEN